MFQQIISQSPSFIPQQPVFIQQQQPVLSPGFNQPVMTAPVSRVVINTVFSPVRKHFPKRKSMLTLQSEEVIFFYDNSNCTL